MTKKTPPGTILRIRVLYQDQRLSSRQIANALSISQRTVMRYITEFGINRSVIQTNSLDESLHELVLGLYQEGHSSRQVAAELGISKTTVLDLARNEGLTRSGCEARGISTNDKNRAIQEYMDGKSSRQVGELFDVDHGTVLNWVKEAGCGRSMAEAAAQNAAKSGTRGNFGIRSRYSSPKTNGNVRLESLFERARILQLNDDPSVVRIDRAADKIPYGDCKSYVPDLCVTYKNRKIVVEEVKPRYRLKEEIVINKTTAAEEFYRAKGIDFRVITEFEIGQNYFDKITPSSISDSEDGQRKIRQALNTIRCGIKRDR